MTPNPNQYASIVRTVLKMLGAFLITHGYTAAGNFVNGQALAGAVLAIIGIILSLITHSDASATPPPASTGSKPPLMLLMIPFLVFSVFFAGCSTTPQRAAYEAAGTTQVTVDTAMTLWGAYVAANHPGTNAEAVVNSAYSKYQTGFAVLADAGAIYAATGGTNSAATAALSQATSNIATEISDLENLIASYGVTLK